MDDGRILTGCNVENASCGRCRQLLFENGGSRLRLLTVSGVRSMEGVRPDAFGPENFT